MRKYTVVLGITGSIAAYKSCEIIRSFVKAGADVFVILTKNGAKFITPQTLETLSNHPVITDMFERDAPWEVEHVALARKADAVIIAPGSANTIAKYAHGICDDMLTTTLMATHAPVLIAPAMNTAMLCNPATQANIRTLKDRGVKFITGVAGELACGETGAGRLADVEDIVQCTLDAAYKKDLAGKKIVVTAGPTRESMDPVRFLTNRSSGKMGYALARAAYARGAEVALISGPTSLKAPYGVETVPVETTKDMLNAVLEAFSGADAVIKAAAPADYRPETVQPFKIKKDAKQGEGFSMSMLRTPDILTSLAPHKERQLLIGFAAETHDVRQYALDKLARKGLDMICANNVLEKGAGFVGDTNHVVVFRRDGQTIDLGLKSKLDTAHAILDQIVELL